MNPQYDMYGPVPGLDYDRSRFPHAHAPPPGLAPPPTLTAAGNKYQYAAYRQDSPSEFAPATYGSGSPQPLSDHPFEFDSEFALGTIDPALPSADAAAQLAPNWYLDFTNIPGLLDVPLSSPGTAYPTVHNPTGMLNEQPQQPDIYVHGMLRNSYGPFCGSDYDAEWRWPVHLGLCALQQHGAWYSAPRRASWFCQPWNIRRTRVPKRRCKPQLHERSAQHR
ncbi:hypothetical protein FRC10_003805, partial [Ceratobasidium sp. 414]